MRSRFKASLWVVGALALFGAGRWALSSREAEPAARDPKQILGRVWFDHLPKSRSDDVTIAVFFGGGIGLYDKGSTWRSTIDVFDFERRKDTLDLTFLHDKKTASTKFEIKSCADKPPFDVCVTFDDAPRGPKTLYGFAYDDEMDRAIPWAREVRDAEKSRAALARSRDGSDISP